MARKFLLLGIAFFVLVLLPNSVIAHANLVESDPAANAVIAQPPTTARLRFTEPLEPTYSRAVLNTSDGTSVSTEPSRVAPDDPYVLLLNLPELPEGVYALQWRTLSEVDGHTAQGVVPFAIGDPAAANAPLVLPPTPPDPLAVPSLVDVTLRWLTVLSLALVVGALVFGLFLWLPTFTDNDAVFVEAQDRFRRLALAAAALAFVTTLGVLIRAGITAESNILSFAVGSRIGLILSLRLLLTGAVVALLYTTIMHRELSALIVGGGALLTISLLSHSAVPQTADSAAIRPFTTALSVFFDFVHLLATAAWIGALPPLLIGLLMLRKAESTQRGRAATLLVARFTSFATASIIVLAATGTFAALQRMAAINELWTTTYGRALAVKLVLFGLIGLLGGFIRWRIHPRSLATSTYSDAMLQTLRRSVTAEVALSVLLIAAVGVLTASAPGRDAATQNADYADTVRVGDVTLSLQVARGELGDIYAVTTRGLPADVEPEVVVRASMPTHMAGEQELQLQQVEAGRWGARGSLLTMPGEWSVETIVRAIGMNDVRHTFVVNTTPVAERTTSTTTAPIGLLAFVIACLVVGLSQLPFRKAWQYRFQLSGIMLLLVAFFASVTPYYIARATEQTNPLSATPDVLAAGQTVYQQNCVTCHGVGGRGDGPAARSLPGLPADFTVPHFATHTDGQVFGWIRGGKPATAMPAFGERLNEDQIWQVVTYIRQLYADAQGS